MKAPVIALVALTILLAVGGVMVARDSRKPAIWIGAALPAVALAYLTVRIARDK